MPRAPEEENLWGLATYRHVSSMHWTFPKTECGRLRAGKLKAVTYAYPPRHEENAEEEEEEEEEDSKAEFLIELTTSCLQHKYQFC